ncbi:MAG: glycoside hydrolase family 15 protein [Thermoleophilia bacterium]|nr:glycoside hydrolase family 15 protein [Thermoleophilia bacterium]MDH3725234.1 glycoside hydrolase family 15 protein [Thermoleophilia bacterium]
MSRLIEDYALLSDSKSAALVSRAGSVDWLCFPRFDSPACFAALVGSKENGHWSLSPATPYESQRAYRSGSLVLDTLHHTGSGSVVVTDSLVPGDDRHRLIRIVEGRGGTVPMRSELRIRFDYGSIVPWVRRAADALHAVGGPDALVLRSDVASRGEDFASVSEFEVRQGDVVTFDLAWHQSSRPAPAAQDPAALLDAAVEWWQRWSRRLRYDGAYRDDVHRSLTVLKGLTHQPTGAVIAAPTTSLPEWIGGTRNWDYRYCWLRDATFTLLALSRAGCLDEAKAWRDWLVRAVAGDPSKLQIMYGIGGERRLPELELDWLEGFEGSRPVRVGNGAAAQLQLDVFGEVVDAMYQARLNGMEPHDMAWGIQEEMLEWLEGNWRQPDDGIWEVRSARAHFTHSKVMAWVAFDRAARGVEAAGLPGDAGRWRAQRDEIHREVCEKGVDSRGVFTQAYGSAELDAATLMIPLVGFLPADDQRVLATVEAIRRELTSDGLVYRYASEDGVGGEEGAFLLCSFWLVDCLALMGRHDEAVELFDRLRALRNDVGLLAEEVDPASGRHLGNFPQAFSHLALASSAITLCPASTGPSEARSDGRDTASPSPDA